MPRFRMKGTLTRDAVADLWKHTLSRIPTVIGRLAYLASIRDPNSGVYKHHGLSTAFGRDESIRALRESHESTFQDWLAMSLAERTEDLRAHLESLEDTEEVVARRWLSSNHIALLVPDGARAMERELFQRDCQAILKITRNGFASGLPR